MGMEKPKETFSNIIIMKHTISAKYENIYTYAFI